ncbi:MAG: hypothetical protein LBQ54_12385 [Planctomycetaceae bacterium]|jgi:hypothetical protein|nr:hypothetical protein [Planctomycetaceae bacterium]
MFYKSVKLSTLVLCLCQCVSIFAQDHSSDVSKADVEKLFMSVLRNREQITSGQMEINYTYSSVRDEKPMGKITRQLQIAFDKDRRRIDRTSTYQTGLVIDDIGCIGCYQPELILHYSNQLEKGVDKSELVRQKVITFYDTSQLENDLALKMWKKDFGSKFQYLVVFLNYSHPNDEQVVAAKERWWNLTLNSEVIWELSKITLTQENYNGVLCKKVSFYTPLDDGIMTQEYWISETQGNSIRKIVHISDMIEESDYDEILEVDVAQESNTGIWYPSSWKYERNNDHKPRTREEGAVKNVVFNKPLPEHLFKMKTISIIPKGTRVIWSAKSVPPPDEGKLIWDGENIISSGKYGLKLINEKKNGSRVVRIILVNVIGLSAIAASIFFRRYRKLK